MARTFAPSWLASSVSLGSLRSTRLQNFSNAVSELISLGLHDEVEAAAIAEALGPTLSQCDSLPFDTRSECLGYGCWHLVDRTHGCNKHSTTWPWMATSLCADSLYPFLRSDLGLLLRRTRSRTTTRHWPTGATKQGKQCSRLQ